MPEKQAEDKEQTGPQTIRESGDPLQGAPNEHQSYADWIKMAELKRVDETHPSPPPADVGAESFGASPGAAPAPAP